VARVSFQQASATFFLCAGTLSHDCTSNGEDARKAKNPDRLQALGAVQETPSK